MGTCTCGASWLYCHQQYSRVGLKSDGMTGQTAGHLAAHASASHYMARRKVTELMMV